MANHRNEDSRINVLTCVQKHRWESGNSPSIREIGTEANIKSTSHVAKLINELIEAGYLHRVEGCTRSLNITVYGELYLRNNRAGSSPAGQKHVINYVNEAASISATRLRRQINIPLLGQTVAGEAIPIPVSDFGAYQPDETVTIFEDTLPPKTKQEDLFALRVEGRSMIEANINSGDFIILKRTETASTGDMVVVWMDDTNETTLKYFFPEENGIRLQPANSTMGPIFISKDRNLRVIGQVILVVRSMEV